MNKEFKNNTGSLKKIFNFLDSRLIIDKSIDFVLIFIGLLAALSFENYIEKQNIEREYLDNLSRVHTEITNNINSTKVYEKSTLTYFSICKEIINQANQNEIKSYGGTLKIIDAEPKQYEDQTFLSIDQKKFINNRLLSELLHVYSKQNDLSDKFNKVKESLIKLNYSYFDLYANNALGNSSSNIPEYVAINYEYISVTKHVPEIQQLLLDIRGTSERVLVAIENELKKYNTNIDSARSYADYYWLSYNNIDTKEYDETIDFAMKGLKVIVSKKLSHEEKSYKGRLHRNIAWAYEEKENLDTLNLINNDSVILFHLQEWEKCNVYLDQCLIEICDHYHRINDFDNFTRSIKKIINNGEKIEFLQRSIWEWENFAQSDTIMGIIVSEEYPREKWLKFIYPETE
tara:strand:- start:114 stop:1319 length:1206 start_codon:yes stop_codon:yes gene_type:complete